MKSKSDTKPDSDWQPSEPEVALADAPESSSNSSHHEDEAADIELLSPPRSSHDKDDDVDKLSVDKNMSASKT